MKFALVTTNLRGGGAEKAMLKLADLLAKRHHEVHLILLEQIIDYAPPTGIRLSALTEPGQATSKGFIGKRCLAWRLRRLISKLAGHTPFDLILTTLPFADEVGRLAHLPRLWHRIANNLSAEIEKIAHNNPRKAKYREQKYQRLYAHSKLIAVSNGVAENLRQMDISACRIERIYSPFDKELIQQQSEVPVVLPSQPYILHVGRFSPQKRHDLLLDAFRDLQTNHQLVLLCHDEPALQRMITERGLGDRVMVAGFQPNPYPWIANADLLVLCSDHEGMPNVLVEALLLHTLVVSTDCPSGPSEILRQGEYGRLTPCGNSAALCATIQKTLSELPSFQDFDATPFLPETTAQQIERLAKEKY